MLYHKFQWALIANVWNELHKVGQEPCVGDVAWFDDGGIIPEKMRHFALAKFLCEGSSAAPPHVQSTLRDVFAGETLPCGISYERACELSWREVPFPTYNSSRAAMYFLELGLWPENTPLPDCKPKNIAHDNSAEAITTALDLASTRTRRQYVWWLRPSPVPFSRRSLALGVYLGAIALMDFPDAPADVLATGDLDNNGSIVAVEGVLEKAALLRSPYDFSAFLVPANGKVPEDNRKIFPVATREDAELLAFCNVRNPHLWRQLRAMREEPSVLWNELLRNQTYTEDEMGFVLREAARHGLFDVDRLDERQLLALFNTLDNYKNCLKIDSIRDTLTPGWINRQEPCAGLFWLAYRLWIADTQRGGHREWEDIVNRLAESSPSRQALVNLARTIATTNARNNAYIFSVESCDILKKAVQRLHNTHSVDNRDPETEMYLAKGYGALVHQYAYCGKWEEARECLQKSLDLFPSEYPQQSRDNVLRRKGDLTCIEWETSGSDTARAAFSDYCRCPGVGTQPDKYALHLRARAAFELDELPNDLSARLPELLGQTSKHSHPYQLFFWNMGRALPENDVYRIPCLEAARDICLRGERFTALTPMALLPLSLLPFNEETRQKTSYVLGLMRSAPETKLNHTHFKAVLDAPDAAAALETVRQKLPQLFPFDYR